MKLFLTGASGFVGSHTLRLALAEGHQIVAPIRPGSIAPRLASFAGLYDRLDLDLRDIDGIASALLQHKPDAVVHVGWSGVENTARFDRRQYNENVECACALVEAAAAAGVKAFIGLGSQGEYGAGSAMTEDSLPRPSTLYGAAKVATYYLTRQLAAQAGMRHAWLRLFSTYGPGDNSGWLIPTLIGEFLSGRRPKTTLGTQYWDWLHVTDVAKGILAVADSHSADGLFNLGSGQAVQVRQVIETLRDLVAPEIELVFGEIPFRPDQVMMMQADISRLHAATGWQPSIDIANGLAETVAWFRERI